MRHVPALSVASFVSTKCNIATLKHEPKRWLGTTSSSYVGWRFVISSAAQKGGGGSCAPIEPSPTRSNSHRVATIMYTSGSTGTPKGVVFTENSWIRHLTHTITIRSIVMLGYLPLSHIAGRVDLYTAMFNGGRIALWSDPADILAALQALNPTAFGAVPRLCQEARDLYNLELQCLEKEQPQLALAERKSRAREKLHTVFGSRLSSIKVTSAPVTPKMRSWMRKTLGIAVSEGYGSTEVGAITVNGHLTTTVLLRSVLRLGYSVKDAPPCGEILVRRDRMRSQGYLGAGASAQAAQKWFATGDIGRWQGGLLTVIDRVESVVKLSTGEFVALGAAERALGASRYVSKLFLHADATKRGYVAIVAPSRPATPSEIATDLRRIAEAQSMPAPCAVHVLSGTDQWPLTDATKPIRRALRDHFKKEIETAYLRAAVARAIGADAAVDDGATFVSLGGDSVSAVRVAEELRAQSLHVAADALLSRKPLSEMVVSAALRTSEVVCIDAELQELEAIVASASADVPRNASAGANTPDFIFMTGATGFLGRFLIRALFDRLRDCRFYCLVRRDSVAKLLQHERIIPLFGDLATPGLGMDANAIAELAAAARGARPAVVHAGASVNHLARYDDLYATNVRSFLELVKTVVVPLRAPLHVVSSSAVHSAAVHRLRSQGYSTSKWAMDSMALALQARGWPVCVYRAALIGGDAKTGEVNLSDWLQRLLRAVVDYGVAPERDDCPPEEDSLNMVSVDYCSDVTAASIAQQSSSAPLVLEIGGRNVGVRALIDAVARRCGARRVPYADWFGELSFRAPAERHPVAPVLERFSDGLPRWPKDRPPFSHSCNDVRPFAAMTEEEVSHCVSYLLSNKL